MDENETLEAVRADLVFYKLEVANLNNTIEFLKNENNALKQAFCFFGLCEICEASDLSEAVDVPNVYTQNTHTQRKREFYHKMKHLVSKQLPPEAPWHIVKQHTDILYEQQQRQSSTPSMEPAHT